MSAGVVHDNYVPTSTHRGRSRAQYLQELGELRESEDVFDGGEEEFWIQAVRADLPPGSLRPVDPSRPAPRNRDPAGTMDGGRNMVSVVSVPSRPSDTF